MSDLYVAKTILEQLGGGHFRMMTGAKNLVGSENSLAMKINSVNYDRKRVNRVVITLDPSDTYTLKAYYVTVKGETEVYSQSDVYCDEIREVFTKATGLYTSLFGKAVA